MHTMIGTMVTLLPLLIFGFVVLRRNLPVLFFYFAMSFVGLGYLVATGAMDDIGSSVITFAKGNPTQ